MFELDLDAIEQAASGSRLTANPANVANPAPSISQNIPELAALATLAISHAPATAANEPALVPAVLNPDRHCWPHTHAMNTAELHALQRHLTRLQSLGLGLDTAERLSYRMVWAQRQHDAGRMCLQCQHLGGQVRAWHCRNALQAGVSLSGRVSVLSPDWVTLVQRCRGFASLAP